MIFVYWAIAVIQFLYDRNSPANRNSPISQYNACFNIDIDSLSLDIAIYRYYRYRYLYICIIFRYITLIDVKMGALLHCCYFSNSQTNVLILWIA